MITNFALLTDPSENETILYRMLLSVRRSLEGDGGALSGWGETSGPFGGDGQGGFMPGQILIVGANGQITPDSSCTGFMDTTNKRIGINSCGPAYTLDVTSNECGSNVLALRGGLLSVDMDSHANFDANPNSRIRTTRNAANQGGLLGFYTTTIPGVLTERLTINDAGLADFKAQIQIRGGSPGAGKVLQSDADGLASWVSTSSLAIDHGSLSGLLDDDHTQYVLKSLLTAKGSMYVASGSATPIELAAGANGYILSANSAASGGVEWISQEDVVYEPVTNGDATTPELIFADGDVIMAKVA